jgi:hypothetical protein
MSRAAQRNAERAKRFSIVVMNISKVMVESLQLAHKFIEPPVGCGDLAQAPDQQARSAARPQKKREVSEISALNE